MKNKVLSVVEKYNMLNKGDRVIVALSGGADSVCLLHILVSIKEQFNLTVSAAHLNHNLRGEESQRDLIFVRNLCGSLNIRLFEREADIKSIAAKNKQSLELCGRFARYDFFADLAKAEKAKIATAHTASDNLETLLYNLARGTSVNGLRGIIPKRNYIIRPLISVTRAEVEQYCNDNHLEYVTDSTNSSDDYTRNKIRHRIVPVLKEINPCAENSAFSMSGDAGEINEFLSQYALEAFNKAKIPSGGENYYNAENLRKLSPVVQKYGVFLLCKNLGVNNLSRKYIELCAEILNNGGQADLSGGFTAICSQDIFRIVKKEEKAFFEPIGLGKNLRFEFSDKEYSVKETFKKDNCKNLIDYSLTEKNLVFRLKQPGDFINLPKRNVKKSLKKFLIEAKIPREKRDSLIVLALGSEVFWLEGFGTSKAAVPKENSENALEISCKEINNE